jgi:hypothetical protein
MDFVQEENLQRSFFYNSNPKHEPLMKAIDKLNTKIWFSENTSGCSGY